jgi:hypothetical protein
VGAEDTVSPYSTVWNTTAVTNGNYALTARARDAAGLQTTASGVNVTVSNSTGGSNIFKNRFVLLNTAFGDNAKTDTVLSVLQTMANNGYNGAYVTDAGGNCDSVASPSATCIANRDRVKAKAAQLGITLIPVCCGGFEGAYADKSLAEAYPIKGTEFRVTGSMASVLTELSDTDHSNGKFESWNGNAPAAWNLSGAPGTIGTLWQKDTTSIHGGSAALKAVNPGTNAVNGKEVRLYHSAHVKPWRMYRLSVFMKTSNWTGAENMYWEILGSNGWNGPRFIYAPKYRRLTPYNTQAPTNDWTEYWVEFPSMEENYINITAYLYSATTNGTLWIDDFSLREIGLNNGLADSYRPVTVTSLDGLTTYTSGGDYSIPSMSGQTLTIPVGSRITNGSTVRVNWWRSANFTYQYTALASFCRQGQFDAMATQLTQKMNFWGVANTAAIMLGFDEMAAINWDPACGSMSSTIPGQAGRYMAEKVIGPTTDMVRSMYPGKAVIIWNDMFDPYHNAEAAQYLGSNGSFTTPVGSWEGVRGGTYISNWYNAGNTNNMKFWSGLDTTYKQPQHFSQIVGGFYDSGNLGIDLRWRDLVAQAEQQGVTDMSGYIYQSYASPQNFSRLKDVADMWKAAGRWGTGPAVFTGSIQPPPPPTDTAPPWPTGGAPTETLSAGTTQATLTLSTNEDATCKYGTIPNTGYDAIPDLFTETGGIAHSALLTGLHDGQSYSHMVRCQDAASPPNTNTDDYVIRFAIAASSTLAVEEPPPIVDTTPPAISQAVAASVTSADASIRWSTDEPSTSQIEYGPTSAYGSSTTLATVMVTSHVVAVSGLKPETLYHYRVKSQDAAKNLAVSGDRMFTTAPLAIPRSAFKGDYFDNRDLTNLKFTRTDARIAFNWGSGAPDPRIGVNTYSVRWQGDWSFAAAGTYRFVVQADDGIRLWVDGVLLIDKWIDQASTTYTVDQQLPAGLHRVKVEYYENEGAAVVSVQWAQVVDF